MTPDEALAILVTRPAPPSRWRLFPPKSGVQPSTALLDEAFQTLVSTPGTDLLPTLACLLWESPDCGERLHQLFMESASRLPPSSWPLVEELIRQDLLAHGHSRKPASLTLSPGLPAGIAIAIFHPSGHVREQAIPCSRNLGGLEAPLLMVRVNDWVEPVRDAAAARLAAVLGELSPARKTGLIPLLARLRECSRHRRHKLLENWMHAMASPFDKDAWLAAWRDARPREKRIYLELLRMQEKLPDAEIRRVLLESNDRLALYWLIRDVMPLLEKDEAADLNAAVRGSRSVVVRRMWLQHSLDSCPVEESTGLLREALLSHGKGVRQFARFHLARISPMDFTSFYREALTIPATEAVALSALAEVNADEGHKEAVSRLESQDPRVMKAALGALAPDTLGSLLDNLLAISDNPSPGVGKLARKRLIEIRRFLGTELLARPEIWDRAGDSSRSFFILQTPAFQKWDGLEFLLTRAAEGVLPDELLLALDKWRMQEQGAFVRLSPARSDKLLKALDGARLPARQTENIRFVITHAE